MLPTAACHLLPFRSQTSHQLPPLLQSQTPFVSHLSLLSMFTTFPDLLSSLEYRAGKVQACWSGQTAENWRKAQNSPLLQCVVHVGRLCDNSSPDPPPQETETEHSCCWRQAALSDGKEAQVIFVTSSGSRSERQAGSDASLVSTLVSQAPRTCSGGCWLFFSKPKAFTLSSMSYLIWLKEFWKFMLRFYFGANFDGKWK